MGFKLITICPASQHIDYSDYVELVKQPGRVQFSRIIEGEGGFQFDNPGARIRFCTNATSIVARLYYNGLHTRLDALNGVGVYLRDRMRTGDYCARERPGELRLALDSLNDGAPHLYEILMPYGDSVEFHGLEVNDEAIFFDVPPRPSIRWIAYGDSITQGFSASDVTCNYSFQVGKDRHWQVINIGLGSRRATVSDGEAIARLNPSLVTVAIGTNDGLNSKPLENFKDDVLGFISKVRIENGSVPIYILTPLAVPECGWDGADVRLEPYRQVLRDLVRQSGDNNLKVIEGPKLIPSELRYFRDGLHPNDEGFYLMANNLSPLLNTNID